MEEAEHDILQRLSLDFQPGLIYKLKPFGSFGQVFNIFFISQ